MCLLLLQVLLPARLLSCASAALHITTSCATYPYCSIVMEHLPSCNTLKEYSRPHLSGRSISPEWQKHRQPCITRGHKNPCCVLLELTEEGQAKQEEKKQEEAS